MKRQPRMTLGCTSWRKNFASFASLLFSLAAISPGLAHDYLEIRIKLSSTWAASTRTNEHEATAVCVLGTNDWYISGQFLRNAHLEYWLIGTNVVERKEINSNMYLKRAEDYVLEKLGQKRPSPIITRYPEKGKITFRTNSWFEPFGYGVERAVWLAFCSGTFLRTPGREVPLPLGYFSKTTGFADKTEFHADDGFNASPPKTVTLFDTNQATVCRYETVATTNVLGRILPTEFRLVQHGITPSRTVDRSKSTLVGKVESMRRRQKPAPPEVEQPADSLR